MNSKDKAMELIARLPDDATAADIIAELYVQMKVETGIRELDGGEGIDHAEAKERLRKWLD